jgi:hypothetical protein
MNQGVVGSIGAAVMSGLAALAAIGCSSSDKPSSGPNMTATADCGSVSQPKPFMLSNVTPATGSSVANSGIVQSFTLVGVHVQLTPTLALAAAHTSGGSTPQPVHWLITASGADTVYTSEAITWQTAPGHVELDPPGAVVDTTTNCVSTLPTPVFSYDVTAP